jgi:hypothetical protein
LNRLKGLTGSTGFSGLCFTVFRMKTEKLSSPAAKNKKYSQPKADWFFNFSSGKVETKYPVHPVNPV